MKRACACFLILAVFWPVLLLPACAGPRPLGAPDLPPPVTASGMSEAPPPPPAPTDWHSGVKTDYSALTPYKQPAETYTRLKSGALPELVPSGQYGQLMPYVGETMYADNGYDVIQKYGLVSESGMIVTDPVYSAVFQGTYYDYGSFLGGSLPVYGLEKLRDSVDKNDPSGSRLYAVCAADGSWVTPFAYSSVNFTDKVMILTRDDETNNIDIMDFRGKLLYNTTSLGCYNDIPPGSSYQFMSGYGEGLMAVPLTGGRTVFIDALTGTETYTDYAQGAAFSEGYAAVMKDGLYGFIDKSFTLVITPRYMGTDYFNNGKCIVQNQDQSYAVIDASGKVLLKNQYYMSRWSSYYSVDDANNNAAYYDDSLNRLTDNSALITPVYGSDYFSFSDNGDTVVFRGSERHTLKGITGINAISGGLVAVYTSNAYSWAGGVMTLDGNAVIPLTENLSPSFVTSETSGKTFILAVTNGKRQTYKVYDTGGNLLFSGDGYASYNASCGLFEVISDFSYAWVDTNGRDVFRISLLKYLPD